MLKCWASGLGGCDYQSSEHLVTESFWSQAIEVQGLSWCKTEPKRIGVSSITQKTLCHAHNSQLSSADAESKKFFDGIGNAARLAYRRNKQVPHRRWKAKRFLVDGVLLERWFLKTTINILIAQNKPEVRWEDSRTVAWHVPPFLVDVAYGKGVFPPPMGLYSVSVPSGEGMQPSESMSFAPLLKNNVDIIGGLFTFRGLRYLLHVGRDAPPSPLALPDIGDQRMSEWRTGAVTRRVRRLEWTVGKHVSHRIEFQWPKQ